jgi:urea transport system substrate-binding protein
MSESDSTEHTQVRAPVSADTSRLPRNYPFLTPPQSASELGRLDDYRVLRLLGSGGMGYVFEAEEISLERPVALKVLKPDLALESEHRERFIREARAAADVASDHVVTILHIGEVAGTPYIAMPLLAGQTLQNRIEQPTLVEFRMAVTVLRDVAAGLAAAHAVGLIHRDIKPANIWLETEGPDGPFKRARILDFGLARRPHGETSLTSTGFIVGTPNYMSPEQAAGNEVDHRADLFSLGCVAYTVLTGELPFQGGSAMAVMMALANKTPEPVRDKNPAVPVAVSNLVARMLAKNPNERVQSAPEVVRELDAVLATFSVCAIPITLPAPQANKPLGADTLAPSKSVTLPSGVPVPPATPELPVAESRLRSARVRGFALALVIGLVGFLAWYALKPAEVVPVPPPEPIALGVIYSQSGTMAVTETPLIDATQLAIEEINAGGGVMGRPLRMVLVDGKSKLDELPATVERLLNEEKVAVVFGCGTSAMRRTSRAVIERNDSLLFYPMANEGLEESPRIVYLGSAPNQNVIPAVDYLIDTLQKKRIAFVGTDSIFPKAIAEIVRARVQERKQKGSDVAFVAEHFLPFGSNNALPAVNALRNAKPDVIINTIHGTTNAAFFSTLRESKDGIAGVTTLSLTISENEVAGLNPPTLTDDYVVASFFQSHANEPSREFVRKVHAKYGSDRVVSDPMAAAYSGVHLWAQAANRAKSLEPAAIVSTIRGFEFDCPRGRVKIDKDNHYSWLPVRIGKVQPNGTIAVIPGAGSEKFVRPQPFPAMHSAEHWNQFLRKQQFDWGARWQPLDRK